MSRQAPPLAPRLPLPDPGQVACPACAAAFVDAQQARIEVAHQQALNTELRQQVATLTARAERAERLFKVRADRCKMLEARLAATPPAPRAPVPAIPGPRQPAAAPEPPAEPAGPLLEIE